MLRFLLDTDTCIYVIRNKPPRARAAFAGYSGAIAASSITFMELLYGAARSARVEDNRRVVEGFIGQLTVLDFDARSASHTADIRHQLKERGAPIGSYDAMIAGIARSHGLILVTHNTREFERVDGLRLEDWGLTD